jgi:2-hydroxychromene-2-carboxylate isomerase
MHLEIFSDTVCPWCYIGKRRLERALRDRPMPDLAIRWRAFQLNPGMPAGGMDRRQYMAAKFGSAERAARLFDTVTRVGAEEGIRFAFDRITRTPNTMKSHRLLALAAQHGRQSHVLDRLFAAYFAEGRDIGQPSVLVEIGASRWKPPYPTTARSAPRWPRTSSPVARGSTACPISSSTAASASPAPRSRKRSTTCSIWRARMTRWCGYN